MSEGIDEYYQLIKQPWGRMFYDVLRKQLNIDNINRLKILDFGSGFGVTADYYARRHEVTAVEINSEMSDKRFAENKYVQIIGGIDALADFSGGYFDVVICHNVLEYAENRQDIFCQLAKLIKSDGIFSVIKHNALGRVMSAAVFGNNPEKALNFLHSGQTFQYDSNSCGNGFIYDDNEILNWAKECRLVSEKMWGIRTCWALSQNNEIKYDDFWYRHMLELEIAVSDMDEFKEIAFFHHFLFRKL